MNIYIHTYIHIYIYIHIVAALKNEHAEELPSRYG